MRYLSSLLLLAFAAQAFAANPDENRIEQLMTSKPAAAAPAERKPARGKPEADSATSLVGQRVAVETRSRGLYLGTLTAVSRDALTLVIELPARSLSYTLPRANVARITPR